MNPAERELERHKDQMQRVKDAHVADLESRRFLEFRRVWGKAPLDLRASMDLAAAEQFFTAGWAGAFCAIAEMAEDE